jgi:hypothetical protein
LAAANETRIQIYNDLVKMHKPELFPEKYLTQSNFAISHLWASMSEEEEYPDKLSFIKYYDKEYKGKLSRFYTFNIEFNYDGEKSYYLGICGPYNTDNSFDPAFPEICSSPWTKFDRKNIENDLNEFLSK